MDCESDASAIMALQASIDERQRDIKAIINKYKEDDTETAKRASARIHYPYTEIVDELTRAMRCLGDITVNYGLPGSDEGRFRLVDGSMYAYQCRTRLGLREYAMNLLGSRAGATAGIKHEGMRRDFEKFWEFLKAYETLLTNDNPIKEPILNIRKRDVYVPPAYGNELLRIPQVDRIKRDNSAVEIRLIHPGSTPFYKYTKRHRNQGNPEYGDSADITTGLVAQIPEILDLLALREDLNRQYAILPSLIHEAANEYLGKWLTIMAI